MKNSKKDAWLHIFADIAVFGICLLIFALFHHVLPHTNGNIHADKIDYSKFVSFEDKFKDKFASPGEVISTDSLYKTENVCIEISSKKFNGAVCHIADVFVRDVSFIRTAFAKGTFGKSISDSTINMALENNAAFAISGDYYGIRDRGIVIRNGTVYRKTKAHDVCVLLYDGRMETFDYSEFSFGKVSSDNIWQAWDFGPELLDKNGNAFASFDTGIAGNNPRCAIGYFEEGHYVFVAVDGRQTSSDGLSLVSLADFFCELGCKKAYNLDGGHSAVMTYFDRIINSPSKADGRDISDIIFISKE